MCRWMVPVSSAGKLRIPMIIHGNATATLPSETFAIARFQPERVRDGFAKTLGRFYLLPRSPSLRCRARQPPYWKVLSFICYAMNSTNFLNRKRVVVRSLRRGWASPPLQGQALGRLKKWVRFASIFSLSWLPPCPLRWGFEDASLSFSPPSGQPRINMHYAFGRNCQSLYFFLKSNRSVIAADWIDILLKNYHWII